jgi:hypothetical protein
LAGVVGNLQASIKLDFTAAMAKYVHQALIGVEPQDELAKLFVRVLRADYRELKFTKSGDYVVPKGEENRAVHKYLNNVCFVSIGVRVVDRIVDSLRAPPSARCTRRSSCTQTCSRFVCCVCGVVDSR